MLFCITVISVEQRWSKHPHWTTPVIW